VKCAAEKLLAFKVRPALLSKCILSFYPIRAFSIAPHASSVALIFCVSDTLNLCQRVRRCRPDDQMPPRSLTRYLCAPGYRMSLYTTSLSRDGSEKARLLSMT